MFFRAITKRKSLPYGRLHLSLTSCRICSTFNKTPSILQLAHLPCCMTTAPSVCPCGIGHYSHKPEAQLRMAWVTTSHVVPTQRLRRILERTMGFEPTTFCLASRSSTTELPPQVRRLAEEFPTQQDR